MSRLSTSFVLGYHGCDASLSHRVLNLSEDLRESNEKFDWLGPGVYFWESDPLRALEWAQRKVAQGRYKQAAVLGAIIDLGNCLDLTQRENLDLLGESYQTFCETQRAANLKIPVNRDAPDDPHNDKLLRFLDCAVIRHLHYSNETAIEQGVPLQRFDTVRGLFVEGEPAYPGGGFYKRTHSQIAVRSMACIKGYFRPQALPETSAQPPAPSPSAVTESLEQIWGSWL